MADASRALIATLTLALGATACGAESTESGPVDVSGDYTLALTNREDGCAFGDWEVGAQASGVSLVVNQEDAQVTGEIESVAGLFLLLVTGSTTFRGTANSVGVRMDIEGNIRHAPEDEPGCEFWVDAYLAADLEGDALDGTITYTRRVAPNFTCPAESGCSTVQQFTAVRPPK